MLEKLFHIEHARSRRAFELFERMPLPSPKSEEWRYTDLTKVDFSSCAPIKKVKLNVNAEKVAIKGNSIMLEEPEDKIGAFTQAFGEERVFFVDEGNRARLELSLALEGSGALLNRVVVGERASLDFFEHYASSSKDLFSENTVFELKEGARLNYYSIQRFSSETTSFAEKVFHLSKDAEVNYVHADLGGQLARTVVKQHFEGDGASALNKAVFFCAGEQHVDLTTKALHYAERTKNDVLVKGILKGKASAVYRGVVKIAKQARQTDSYLEDRVLHLSKGVSSHSIPSLFIDNNDVKASHGASVSKLSEDALFYLQTRGLERRKAEELVVDGFLKEVIDVFPQQERVLSYTHAK